MPSSPSNFDKASVEYTAVCEEGHRDERAGDPFYNLAASLFSSFSPPASPPPKEPQSLDSMLGRQEQRLRFMVESEPPPIDHRAEAARKRREFEEAAQRRGRRPAAAAPSPLSKLADFETNADGEGDATGPSSSTKLPLKSIPRDIIDTTNLRRDASVEMHKDDNVRCSLERASSLGSKNQRRSPKTRDARHDGAPSESNGRTFLDIYEEMNDVKHEKSPKSKNQVPPMNYPPMNYPPMKDIPRVAPNYGSFLGMPVMESTDYKSPNHFDNANDCASRGFVPIDHDDSTDTATTAPVTPQRSVSSCKSTPRRTTISPGEFAPVSSPHLTTAMTMTTTMPPLALPAPNFPTMAICPPPAPSSSALPATDIQMTAKCPSPAPVSSELSATDIQMTVKCPPPASSSSALPATDIQMTAKCPPPAPLSSELPATDIQMTVKCPPPVPSPMVLPSPPFPTIMARSWPSSPPLSAFATPSSTTSFALPNPPTTETAGVPSSSTLDFPFVPTTEVTNEPFHSALSPSPPSDSLSRLDPQSPGVSPQSSSAALSSSYAALMRLRSVIRDSGEFATAVSPEPYWPEKERDGDRVDTELKLRDPLEDLYMDHVAKQRGVEGEENGEENEKEEKETTKDEKETMKEEQETTVVWLENDHHGDRVETGLMLRGMLEDLDSDNMDKQQAVEGKEDEKEENETMKDEKEENETMKDEKEENETMKDEKETTKDKERMKEEQETTMVSPEPDWPENDRDGDCVDKALRLRDLSEDLGADKRRAMEGEKKEEKEMTEDEKEAMHEETETTKNEKSEGNDNDLPSETAPTTATADVNEEGSKKNTVDLDPEELSLDLDSDLDLNEVPTPTNNDTEEHHDTVETKDANKVHLETTTTITKYNTNAGLGVLKPINTYDAYDDDDTYSGSSLHSYLEYDVDHFTRPACDYVVDSMCEFSMCDQVLDTLCCNGGGADERFRDERPRLQPVFDGSGGGRRTASLVTSRTTMDRNAFGRREFVEDVAPPRGTRRGGGAGNETADTIRAEGAPSSAAPSKEQLRARSLNSMLGRQEQRLRFMVDTELPPSNHRAEAARKRREIEEAARRRRQRRRANVASSGRQRGDAGGADQRRRRHRHRPVS